MANLAKNARDRVQMSWPGATVVGRGKTWIRHKHPTQPNRFRIDAHLAPIHIGATEVEVDTAWLPGVAPWLYQMTLADYHAHFGPGTTEFDAGQILKYTHPGTGANVTFQAQQLQWTNDIDQIQPIADPAKVPHSSLNDDLIAWAGAFGPGLDFEWQTEPGRLAKRLNIANLAAIGAPSQTIINGGNPVIRLQFVFQKSAGVEIWVGGAKWSEKANEPVITGERVEFRSAGQTLWWFDLPIAWDSKGNEILATQRFRKTGNSLFVEVRVPWAWLQSAIYPVVVDPTTSPQVAASADDWRWTEPSTFSVIGSTLQFGATGDNIGMRWTVTGPVNGDTINSGTPGTSGTYLTFVARLGDTTSQTNTNIYGVKGNDPASPTTYSEAESPSGGRTTAFVAWDAIATWVIDNTYYSPDISSVIQEVVDQATWASAEHMVVNVEDDASGSGSFRRARSYDNSTTQCPILTVDYTAGGVTVAPNPATSVAGKVDPTPILGSLSLAPNSATSVAGKVDPTPILGSITYTPSPGFGVAAKVDPATILGSLVLTTTPASGVGTVVAPATILGSLVLLPGNAFGVAAKVDPITILGSLVLTTTPGFGVAGKLDPTVIAGSAVVVTPDSIFAIAAKVDPTPILGSLVLTTTPASGVAGKLDPSTIFGSLVIMPGSISSVAAKVDPATIYGSIVYIPSPAASVAGKADPTTILGSLVLTMAQAAALGLTVDPTTILGSLALVANPATSVGTVVAPATILGSLVAIPGPAGAVALVVDPDVLIASLEAAGLVTVDDAGIYGLAVSNGEAHGLAVSNGKAFTVKVSDTLL